MDVFFNSFRRCKDWADRKFGVFSRLIQFCFVGGSGMVFDLGSYKIMLVTNFSVPLARALAIWIAMTWNYALNRRLTFHDSQKQNIPSQYLKFIAACGLGALLSWSISVGLNLSSAFFHEHKLYAAFLGILVGTFSNFLISFLWVFRRREKLSSSLEEIDGSRPLEDLKP
jgi:dolichol-phosphate mannosyltransferase